MKYYNLIPSTKSTNNAEEKSREQRQFNNVRAWRKDQVDRIGLIELILMKN